MLARIMMSVLFVLVMAIVVAVVVVLWGPTVPHGLIITLLGIGSVFGVGMAAIWTK